MTYEPSKVGQSQTDIVFLVCDAEFIISSEMQCMITSVYV